MNEEKNIYDSFDNNWGQSNNSDGGLSGTPTKFRTLYIIEIFELILAVFLLFAGILKSVPLTTVFVLAEFAVGIVYLVVVLGLKEYNDLFRVAGLFYLSKEILNFINSMFLNGFLELLLVIASAVLNILYILKFCDACVELLRDKRTGLKDSWTKYGKYSLYLFVTIIVCRILAIIPLINILAVMIILIGAVCAIAFIFWHIILLRDTDTVLRGGDVQ